MSKRTVGVIVMPIIYFGLVLVTATLVATQVISEIPLWAPPVFSMLAVIGVMTFSKPRLIDIVAVFSIAILIFPVGLMFIMALAAGLGPQKSATTFLSTVKPSEWGVIISPVITAIVAYFTTDKLFKRNKKT